MGHLFLDIETYSSKENPDSSLNPYMPESKVLVIAYSYYPDFKPPKKEGLKPPVFLNEWESDEKAILFAFHKLLKELELKDQHLNIHGYNILKFDLPYLFGRMVALGLDSQKNLHNLLFRPFGTDMYQISPIISERTKSSERLWGLSHKEACRFFNLQEKEGTGLDCSRYYDAKEYDKIVKYCTQEFNLEQLMDCFYLHVVGGSNTLSHR